MAAASDHDSSYTNQQIAKNNQLSITQKKTEQ